MKRTNRVRHTDFVQSLLNDIKTTTLELQKNHDIQINKLNTTLEEINTSFQPIRSGSTSEYAHIGEEIGEHFEHVKSKHNILQMKRDLTIHFQHQMFNIRAYEKKVTQLHEEFLLCNHMGNHHIKRHKTDNPLLPKTNTSRHRDDGERLKELKLECETLKRSFLKQFSSDTVDHVSPTYMDVDVCEICNTNLRIDHISSQSICPNCANVKNIVDSTRSAMAFDKKMSMTKFPQCRYKRKKQYLMYLRQYEAGNEAVPSKIIKIIKDELEKTHHRSDVKSKRVTKILEKYKYYKYRDHARYIARVLNNQPIAELTNEEIDQFMDIYSQALTSFENLNDTKRSNFFGKTYISNRISEILNKPWFKKCFPMLKTSTSMKTQDALWKKICEERNWIFTPSH